MTINRTSVCVLSEESSENLSGDAHIAKVTGKGRSQEGKMDATLTDSQLDTGINVCIMMIVFAPRQGYAGEVSERDAELVKQLEIAQMAKVQKALQWVLKYDGQYRNIGRFRNVPI